MKVLAPALTIVMVSHVRPPLLDAAIQSVLHQTRKDFELIVADSGAWHSLRDQADHDMDMLYGRYMVHPQVTWLTTGELPNPEARYCPFTKAINNVVRAGLIRSRYMCIFSDDDLYHPQFVERTVGLLDAEGASAVIVGQKRSALWADGRTEERPSLVPSAKNPGDNWDCLVDGNQVVLRTSLLDKIGDPWWPEDAEFTTCNHADGIFFNKMAQYAGHVPVIPDLLEEHRFTWLSTYTPAGA